MTAAKKLLLKPDFPIILGRYDIGVNVFAEKAGIARSTIYGLLNPTMHPWRRGSMHPRTAWKIVNAFAKETGMTPEEAWAMIMIEIDTPYRETPNRKRPYTEYKKPSED